MPRSFTLQSSYRNGMTFTVASCGRARLAGDADACTTAIASCAAGSCFTTARGLSLDVERLRGCACWAKATGCGSTRTMGSMGAVATGAAEGCPRCVPAVENAANGAASVGLLEIEGQTGGWNVGGKPGGVY
jgi:hypothetical protein